jgi:hypothetical protein
MDKKGLLRCTRYAIAPNHFGYCGPKKTETLLQQINEDYADKEMSYILSEFETLYPYLQYISRYNKIADPFNEKVVEAYWVGNSLLKQSNFNDYLNFLDEKLLINKKFSKDSLQNLKIQLSKNGHLPHHSFHVFNIFKSMASHIDENILNTMEQCRIGWGKVISTDNISYAVVSSPTIKIDDNAKIYLAKPISKKIKLRYKDTFLVNKKLKLNSFISIHWGYFCEQITKQQAQTLQLLTQKAIRFYNS